MRGGALIIVYTQLGHLGTYLMNWMAVMSKLNKYVE